MGKTPPPQFGALLREFRTTAGLTQEELAERARLSKRGLQDLERGVSRRPRRDTLELLARALQLSGSDREALVAAARAKGLPPATAAAVQAIAPPSGNLLPLVGRREEILLMERFLFGERTTFDSVAVLLLAGEPGIGKTRLLQAAAQMAVAGGWCVLVGGCFRRDGHGPYAPLLEALAHYLHAARPARLREVLAGCAWLARLMPELAEVMAPPAGALVAEQERRLIYAAVSRFLANVAGPAGTLLVLDDLQWASPDALDLLATLVRGAGDSFLVVGAYRDTEVEPGDPLGLLCADLAQAQLVRQHTIGPLHQEESSLLLNSLLTGLPRCERGAVERALQRADGSPFALASFAQALREKNTDGVPWNLTQALRQRVALLPSAGRELLAIAATVGRRIPRTLLAAIAAQPEEALLTGLEAACKARLLLEDGDAGYSFAHDVIREVVEGDLGAARRATLHRRVAEAQEQACPAPPPETLAYHYAQSDQPDKAIPYLERAGDHAWNQRAHRSAEHHYRTAIVQLERLEHRQAAARLREKLGEVLRQIGQYQPALQALMPAAEAYRAAGNLESFACVMATIGGVHALRGNAGEGIALLLPLVQQLDCDGAPRSLAVLYLRLGMTLFKAGRYEESLLAGERAATLARSSGDDQTRVRAAWNRANILQMLGRLEEALQADQDVLTLARKFGNVECQIAVARDLAYIHVLRGNFALGRHWMDQSLAVPEQVENPAGHSFTLALRSWGAILSGDLASARADLDQARARSKETDRSWHTPYIHIFLARLTLAEDALPEASASAQHAIMLATPTGDLQALRWAAATMAEIDLLEGRPEAARARLLPLLDRSGLEECDVTVLLPVLALAHLEAGDPDAAMRTVEQAIARARPEGMRLVLVEALRIQVLVALRRQDWAEAARTLEEGLGMAREMRYPLAEARLRLVAGLLCAQQHAPAQVYA